MCKSANHVNMKLLAAVALMSCFAVIAGQLSSESPKPTTVPPVTALPSTTPSPTGKTSSAPNTTTQAPPMSTTVAPPVLPPATSNTYVLKDNSNRTCLMMTATLQLKVAYPTTQGKYETAVVPLSNDTRVDPARSTCNGTRQEQVLTLAFGSRSNLTMTFTKNGTVYVSGISVSIVKDSAHFPDAAAPETVVTASNQSLELYSVSPNLSYRCTVDSPVYVGSNVTVDVVSVRLQAFVNNTGNPDEYGAPVECSTEDISNIVPIAVGSALALLVVVVLIAYLVGRQRSRQKGYQSV